MQNHTESQSKKGVAVFILNKETKQILVVKRRENQEHICFPGGKVDGDETYLEAAQRELVEETGLSGLVENFEFISEGVFFNLVDKKEYKDQIFFVDYKDLYQVTEDFETFTHPHLVSLEVFKEKNFNPIYFVEFFKRPNIIKKLQEYGFSI